MQNFKGFSIIIMFLIIGFISPHIFADEEAEMLDKVSNIFYEVVVHDVANWEFEDETPYILLVSLGAAMDQKMDTPIYLIRYDYIKEVSLLKEIRDMVLYRKPYEEVLSKIKIFIQDYMYIGHLPKTSVNNITTDTGCFNYLNNYIADNYIYNNKLIDCSGGIFDVLPSLHIPDVYVYIDLYQFYNYFLSIQYRLLNAEVESALNQINNWLGTIYIRK